MWGPTRRWRLKLAFTELALVVSTVVVIGWTTVLSASLYARYVKGQQSPGAKIFRLRRSQERRAEYESEAEDHDRDHYEGDYDTRGHVGRTL